MKILLLVNHFAEYGGIEQMLNHKILALKKYENCEIVLVTRFQNNREYLYESHHLTTKYDLNLQTEKSIVTDLGTYYSFYTKLSKIIKEQKPDVILSTLTSYYAIVLPLIQKNVPKIIEFHSTASTIQSGQWKYKKFFYRLYNAVVVLNEEEKNSYDLKNTVVIPNFIHNENVVSMPEFSLRTKKIIAAGRLEEVKQFDHLILAWKQLAIKHADWKVEIYGEGSKFAELNELIKENNLSNSIQLKGNTKNLSHIMSQASIYCLTSKTECFPMVLLEAKQVGLPVISYACPYGPQYIVKNDEDGFLIKCNDIDLLSIALDDLIFNTTKREKMAEIAYHNFKEFSSEKIIFSWVNLFNSLKGY